MRNSFLLFSHLILFCITFFYEDLKLVLFGIFLGFIFIYLYIYFFMRNILEDKSTLLVVLGTGVSVYFFINLTLTLICLFSCAIFGLDISSVLSRLFPFFMVSSYTLALHRTKLKSDFYQINGFNSSQEFEINEDTEEKISDFDKSLVILNIEKKDLDGKTLKSRYKEFAFLYHPDRITSLSESRKLRANEEFRRIKSAYEFLLNELKNEK